SVSSDSPQPITADDVTLSWICCEALLRLCERHREHFKSGGEPVVEELRLEALPQSPTVTVIAPHPELELSSEEADGLFEEVHGELEGLIEAAKKQAEARKKPS